MALYSWTDGELVTAEKLNNYGSGMEAIKSDAETARDDAQAAAKEAERTLASKADVNSPALTGAPTAPTPDASDSSTRLATTEFVDNAVTDNLGGVVFSVTADGLLHIEQKEG